MVLPDILKSNHSHLDKKRYIMTRLNNKGITWSLAKKAIDGLYYDKSDINPVPACLECTYRDICNYGCSNDLTDKWGSCFRFARKRSITDKIHLYADLRIASWSEGINIFMRGKTK